MLLNKKRILYVIGYWSSVIFALTGVLSFLATSLFCLLGFIGFILDSPSLQLIFQLGMTVSLTVGTILIAVVFKSCIRQIQ